MKKNINRFQFVVFSLLTLVISITSWVIAREQTGLLKLLLNQFGYFGPALVAIFLTVYTSTNKIQIKSYLPFFLIFLCIIIFAFIYSNEYYEIGIIKLLSKRYFATVLVTVTVAYFIYQYSINRGKSGIYKLIYIPKTNFIWYVLAIIIYPLFKFVGVLLSMKLYPTHFELPIVKIYTLIPLFLFSIIFYAAIGEEIGWRGYALKKLQLKYNPFVATLFIGIVWSVWHIGYFMLVEDYVVQSIPSIVIFTFLSAFFCTWFFNKTKGNVLILILFHASVNFAIIMVPHPLILSALHLVLLAIVLINGRFFKVVS